MYEEIRRILSRLSNITMRGRLTLIDNSKSIQTQQNELFAGQTKSDIPAPQQYGFESAPLVGADTINLNRGGSLESGWVVMTYDGRYKPLDLKDGDTIMYTKRDSSSVHRIKFDATTGEILIETDETLKIACKTADIDVSENATIDVGKDLTATVVGDATITAENLDATVNTATKLTTNTADINITANATIDCPSSIWTGNITLVGNLTQTGNITLTGLYNQVGDMGVVGNIEGVGVEAGGIKLISHRHIGNLSSPTSSPIPS